MNREQQERFRDRQLRQKYDLLHVVPTLPTSSLAGLYLKNFYNASKRYNVVLPPTITDSNSKFCSRCGIVYIPNHNIKMETFEEKKKHEENEPEITLRYLKYTCLNCNNNNSFKIKEITVVKDESNQPIDPVAKFNSLDIKTPTTTVKIGKTTGKDRAKKRKQNSLTNLLSSKKLEQNKRSQSNTSLTSLTLESFMKK